MNGVAVKRAMVLAAGRGKRMRPITDTLPKVLVLVHGRTLLDHALDALTAIGVELCVVNTHHLADLVAARLAERTTPRIVLQPEAALLGTGGSVKKALAQFGEDPFYTVNGDSLWRDGSLPMLVRMAQRWDPLRMDALLLLHPRATAHGYDANGLGDYHLAPDGLARWRGPTEVAPFIFAGVTICDWRLYEDTPDGPFSQLQLWIRAEERERLYGLRHDGELFHVGTSAALDDAESNFARGGGAAPTDTTAPDALPR